MPRIPFLSATLFALAAAAAAEDQAPVIVVTAERGESDLARAPQSVELVTADDIRDRGYVLNGADWLRELPGVNVINRYGGLDGGTTDVRVRGVDPTFTQVLIDGLPLNDPTAIGGDYNPSLVNPAGIERVEILKGAQSALYGSRAIGGVVNYLTVRPTAAAHENVRLVGGSWRTAGFEASATGPIGGKLGYAVGISGLSSAGFSTMADPGGDPDSHERDGLHRLSGSARLEARPDADTLVYASGFTQRTDQRYDELGPDDGLPGNTIHTRRLAGGAERKLGAVTVTADVARTTVDKENRSNFGPPPTFVAATSDYRGTETFAQARVEGRPGEHLRLALGADWRGEEGSQGYEGRPEDWSDDARTTGTYLQATWDGVLIDASLSGREDHHSAFGNHASGRAAFAVWPVADAVKLRSAVGTGFRAPSLYQLHGFGDFGFFGTFQGNPDLQPETAISYEAGADWYPRPGIELGTTAFRTNYRRKIEYGASGVPGQSTYNNLDSGAHVRGIEGVARAANLLSGRLDLSAHATVLRSDDGSGNDLAYTPAATGGARATVRQSGRWAWWESLGVERTTGYVTGAGGTGVDGEATVVDAAVGVGIDRTWEASVRIENLFNQRYGLSTPFGDTYSSTPRSLYLSLGATF